MAGKGDGFRPVDRKKFDSNWDRIFSKKEDREAVLEDKNCVKHSENAPDRCPNTIDIEEQIGSDRETE